MYNDKKNSKTADSNNNFSSYNNKCFIKNE
jgi:hypothetical protein